MTKAEHRRRHKKLHRAFDELAADWALHNCTPKSIMNGEPKLFSNTTIMELMQWSHRQTIEPDEEPNGKTD